MSETPLIIMVDTNVWLDLYIPGRPKVEETIEFFKEARRQGVEIAFTLEIARAVFRNVAYEAKAYIRRYMGSLSETHARVIASSAWDAVSSMQEIGTAVGSSMGDLWMAEKLRDEHAEIEDNLIVAACMRCKTDYLVTNDEKLRKHASVATATPAMMLKLLEVGMQG